MKFVKDHEEFWWTWFDQDPVITLFIDGEFYKENNATCDPQGILMREIIDDEVFGLGVSTYAKNGYITDSWLWYRQFAV